MPILAFPLLVLGALASYVAGLGLAAQWHTPFPVEYVISGAIRATAWFLSLRHPAVRSAATVRLLDSVAVARTERLSNA